jgi:hypothetical protein
MGGGRWNEFDDAGFATRAEDSAISDGEPSIWIAEATDLKRTASGEKAGGTAVQSPEQPRDSTKEGPPLWRIECWQQVLLPCIRRQHCIVQTGSPAESAGMAICHAKSTTMNAQIVRRPGKECAPVSRSVKLSITLSLFDVRQPISFLTYVDGRRDLLAFV